MRLVSLVLALLLTVGGLYLIIVGGNSALDYFSALSDVQQRLAGSAMLLFAVSMLALGGILKRRKAAGED